MGIEITPTPIEDMPTDTWSQTDWFMVWLHDQLQLLRWTWLQLNSTKKVPLPDLLPRPGGEKKKTRTLKAWFGLGASAK